MWRCAAADCHAARSGRCTSWRETLPGSRWSKPRHASSTAPTIGIGDGGNEIGFGKIHRRLSDELPAFACKDVTPCGGGVYSVVETDVLLVSNNSNMGANAVTAGLALLRRDLSLCHTAEDEFALAHVGVGLGLIDGGSGTLRPWCDGVPPAANAAVVEIIRTIVSQALAAGEDRKF